MFLFIRTAIFIFLLLFLVPGHSFAKKTIRIGAQQNPPLISVDENGTAKGLSADVLEYVAAQEGWTLEFVTCVWAECLRMLDEGETDVHSVIAYTEERAQKYIYSNETLINNWAVVLKRKDSKIDSLLDLKGKKIASTEKGIHIRAFNKLVEDFDIEYRFYPASYRDAAGMLHKGEVDAAIVARTAASKLIKEFKLVKTSIIFNPIDIRYAAKDKKNFYIIEAIDRHLKELKTSNDSVYYRSLETLFGEMAIRQYPVWFKLVGLVIFFMLAVSIALSSLFRLQVRRKTQELRQELIERKKVEIKLRQYGKIVSASMDQLAFIDRNYTYLAVNDAYTKIYDMENEEIVGKKISDILGDELFNEMVKEQFDRCLTGVPVQYEARIKRSDGEFRDIIVNYIPYKEPDNTVSGLVANIRDISERKNAERELEFSEEMFRGLIENSPFGITLSRDGKCTFVNRACMDIFGYSSFDELLGKKLPDLIAPEQSDEIDERNKKREQGMDVPNYYETVGMKKDGTRFPLEVTVTTIEVEEGVSTLAFINDITERRNQEKIIAETRHYTDNLIQTANAMIIGLDPVGNIKVFNPAAERVTGYSIEDLRGKNWFEVLVPKDIYPFVWEEHKRFMDGGASKQFENPILTKDGQERIITWSNNDLIMDDKVVGTISFGIDITERKRVEAELKLSEERLAALLELSQRKEAGAGELIDFALEECVRFTRSSGGYLHFYDEKNKSLNLYTWSKEVLKDCTAEKSHNYPLEEAGIWADSLRDGKPVIHNDFLNEPGRKGYPEGHFQVNRHMSVPIFVSGKSIGIVGVGNKETPYDGDDVKQITLFMDNVWTIIERNRAEERIRKSLKEKEILLKEVHHRVKNNMAVISSLLSLQSGYVDDKVMLDMFAESQGRIKSMALVHEKLYQSEDFTNIDLEDYIVTLSRNVSITFGSDRHVSISTNIEKVSMDIDTLIPCGLIVNELLTNVFKHAFKGQEEQKIELEMLRSEDNISMRISDNGVGLPEDINPMKSPGLGLKLVTTLVHQLDGTMEVDVKQGTSFNITFPFKAPDTIQAQDG
jgi:PAS domain S-box-containing protein